MIRSSARILLLLESQSDQVQPLLPSAVAHILCARMETKMTAMNARGRIIQNVSFGA